MGYEAFSWEKRRGRFSTTDLRQLFGSGDSLDERLLPRLYARVRSRTDREAGERSEADTLGDAYLAPRPRAVRGGTSEPDRESA